MHRITLKTVPALFFLHPRQISLRPSFVAALPHHIHCMCRYQDAVAAELCHENSMLSPLDFGMSLAKEAAMSLAKKLRQWEAAEILDAETTARIRAFEASRGRPLLLQGLAGLGAATIGIGVISVVAANWAGIDYTMKLGAAGLVGLLLALATYFTVDRGMRLATEALVLINYLFALACLALLGQIYQTGAPAWQALLLWSLSTGALMLLARSTFAGGLWFLGLSITYAFAMVAAFDGFSSAQQANSVACALFAWPLLMVAAAKIPLLVRKRPRLAGAFSACAWVSLLSALALIPFVFYSGVHSGELLSWAVLVTGLMALGLHLLLPRWYPDTAPLARLGVALSVYFGWMTLALGTTFARGSVDAVGAIMQIMYLAVLAWTSVQLGWTRAFNVLTAVIALRILIVYFEVFGSMLSTGVGMITGGILTLLMTWLWKRRSTKLAEHLTLEGGPHHA